MWKQGGRGFCDLCIDSESPPLQMLLRLGYSTIALNTTIDESVFEVKKKHKKGEHRESVDPVPAPKIPPSNTDDDKLKIFHRLTIKFSDISLLLKLNQSENIKKYDLIAAMPADLSAFTHACTVMDVDIISFDAEEFNNFKIHRKLYSQAVERGIYIEIMYSPALKTSNYRRNVFTKANVYKTVGKSKNVIVSSGAENEYQVRGPYDVIRLGDIFGLDQNQAILSITEHARKVLLKGDSRRRGKSSLFVIEKDCKVVDDSDEEPTLKKLKIV